MATLFMTGFNGITTAQLDRRGAYGVGTLTIGATGEYGQALRIQSGADSLYAALITEGSPVATVYAGVRVKPVSVDAGDDPDLGIVFSLGEVSTEGTNITVTYDFTSESFEVTGPGPSHTYLGGTPTGLFSASEWHTVEVMCTVSGASGAVILRVDGHTYYSGTGLDTQYGAATGSDYIGLGGWGMGDAYFDGVYVNDTTGEGLAAGFFGPFRVDAVFPSADGSITDFTPLSGTNVSNVDDGNTPDDATSYNESTTSGDRDLFALPGTFTPASHVLGVVAVRATAISNPGLGAELAAVFTTSEGEIVGDTTPLDNADYTEAVVYFGGDLESFKSIADAEALMDAAQIGYEIP